MAAEDIVEDLLRENATAIQIYRPSFATPENIDAMRFWVKKELDNIQASFSDTDETFKQLAEALDDVIVRVRAALEGTIETVDEISDQLPVPPVTIPPATTGVRVFRQEVDPVLSATVDPGDIWMEEY